MQPALIHTAEWAAVASAALAAFAAGASWASVWQNRRERLAAATPELHFEVIYLTGEEPKVRLSIANNGGAAKNVYFCIVIGSEVSYGHPQPTAFFRPGESRIVGTQLTPPPSLSEKPKAMVACHDTPGSRLYVFTQDKPVLTYRLRGLRRTRKNVDGESWLHEYFPDVEWDKLTWKSYKTEERTT